jgi:hypothetical protein
MATVDEWALIVSSRCRHLDGALCSVYGQPERPLRCAYFDEWNCTYKAHLGARPPEDAAILELDGFLSLEKTFALDSDGRICDGPSIDDLRASQRATV